MATYSASNLLTKQVPSIDNACILTGRVTPGTNTATGDVLRPCKVPAGVRALVLHINVVTAFASTAPAKIGFSHVGGESFMQSNPDVALAAAADTSHASTGIKTIVPAAEFVTERESYLEIVFGTIATAASGDARYVLIGEWHGSK